MKTNECNRREFFTKLSIALGSIAAAMVGVPVIGSVLAPIFKKPDPVWRQVGNINDFNIGETVKVSYEDPSPLPWAGVTARSAAWLRRDENEKSEREKILK